MKIRYYINNVGDRVCSLWNEALGCYVDASNIENKIKEAVYGDDPVTKDVSAELIKEASREPIDEDEWKRDVPLSLSPSKIVCLGVSYADHAKEFDHSEVVEPAIFLKAISALCSSADPVLCPKGSTHLDYEIELALVIKKRLKNASVDEAAMAIAGYTLLCDYSEREYQLKRGGQWTKGKSYDSFAPVGPSLVTIDELGDGSGIPLELKVNGELRQMGNTSDLIWSVPRLVAYISQFMTLMPGDLISTGTPSGVAMGMSEPGYLRAGDEVEWGTPEIGWNKQVVEPDIS